MNVSLVFRILELKEELNRFYSVKTKALIGIKTHLKDSIKHVSESDSCLVVNVLSELHIN